MAVVNAELGSNIGEKSAQFFHVCAIWSMLHKLANSATNSEHAE